MDRLKGMLLGLAVGDALGTTLEFGPRRSLDNLHTEMTGGGVFDLKPGEWTDDTAMAVAMGRSLVEMGRYDPFAIMTEWTAWYQSGRHSCTGTCFDIGNATRSALSAFSRKSTELPVILSSSLGNGSLMRLAPAVLFASSLDEARTLSYQQSTLTHGEEAAVATAEFGALLYSISRLGQTDIGPHPTVPLHREDVSASGFYRDTYHAALWAVGTTTTFEQAIIAAVNLGGDADTVGAVTGQLAGALYGASSIPERWLRPLAWQKELRNLATALVSRSNAATPA